MTQLDAFVLIIEVSCYEVTSQRKPFTWLASKSSVVRRNLNSLGTFETVPVPTFEMFLPILVLC